MRRSKIGAVAVSLLMLGVAVHADAPAPWFLDEIAKLTGSGGRWIADNSSYKSEQEPYEAYGIEWRAAFDGTTMSGRLFGIVDGKEVADFWEFRQYWDSQRNEAVLQQFGWGAAVGIGKVWREGEVTKSDQIFHSPGRESRRTGHRSSFPTEDTHLNESFDIEGESWKPNRSYTWKRITK